MNLSPSRKEVLDEMNLSLSPEEVLDEMNLSYYDLATPEGLGAAILESTKIHNGLLRLRSQNANSSFVE